METFKFTVLSIIVLFLLGLFGYWAVATIQSGSEHALGEKVETLQNENRDLSTQVENLTEELDTLKSKQAAVTSTTPSTESPKVTTPAPTTKTPTSTSTTPTTTVSKHQDLINELQKLIDDKITMKLKSFGTRVGTVQKFLNIYNGTSAKIDNDYGATTVNLVTAFQKAQGLTANGEAGPTTFAKMIDWLKKQK